MSWQDELRESFCSIDEVQADLNCSHEDKRLIERITRNHPMRVPRYYFSLIDRSRNNGPIRRMAIPHAEEIFKAGTYDTSGEHSHTVMPGLQHKYAQTAVILATSECAMYCRHCFRKRLVGLESGEVLRDIDAAAEYIEEHEEINNVLITGGDPFTLPTKRIRALLERLGSIDTLDFIRFGTRVPVTLPSRILKGRGLLELLAAYSKKNRRIHVVTQFNHPWEITEESSEAVDKLLEAGVLVSNQTVLLRGVNSKPEVLAELQSKLVAIGVIPYYVFQCRPVSRVKRQFQVPLYEGYYIVEEAKRLLNGQSKRFRYIMSHETGKIEIVGVQEEPEPEFIFKYHQAKDPSDVGRIFTRRVSKSATWLDDLAVA